MKLWVIVLGILAACSDPRDSTSLEFETMPLEERGVQEWRVSRLDEGEHEVVVRRVVDAVDGCEKLDAELLSRGRELTLRVRHAPPGRPDGRAAVHCGYTARIRSLPPGRYTLRVVHTGLGSGSPRVVMDQPIHAQ